MDIENITEYIQCDSILTHLNFNQYFNLSKKGFVRLQRNTFKQSYILLLYSVSLKNSDKPSDHPLVQTPIHKKTIQKLNKIESKKEIKLVLNDGIINIRLNDLKTYQLLLKSINSCIDDVDFIGFNVTNNETKDEPQKTNTTTTPTTDTVKVKKCLTKFQLLGELEESPQLMVVREQKQKNDQPKDENKNSSQSNPSPLNKKPIISRSLFYNKNSHPAPQPQLQPHKPPPSPLSLKTIDKKSSKFSLNTTASSPVAPSHQTSILIDITQNENRENFNLFNIPSKSLSKTSKGYLFKLYVKYPTSMGHSFL
jgi:hypothetical protein